MFIEMNKSAAILLAACLAVTVPFTASGQKHPKAPKSLRLYIFDCGTIHTTNGDAYSLKKEEMGSTEMAIPCFMIAHPKGTLMWDNGDIPDSAFKPGGGPASVGAVTLAYTGPSVAVSEAGEDGAGGAERRSLSLSGGALAEPSAGG